MSKNTNFVVISSTSPKKIEKKLNELLKQEYVKDFDVQAQSQGSEWHTWKDGTKEYITKYTTIIKVKWR